MDDETRLQRIKFLVDQSKLYAEFLSSSIKPLTPPPEPDAKKEPKAELEATDKREPRPPPAKKARKGKAKSGSDGQASITSFFKPPAPKSDEQPKAIVVPLHDYQIVALKWLTMLYQNGLNGILADEMGLGKTLEVIAFLAFLIENDVQGPFLVVAPLSTIGNWVSEIEKFAPSLHCTKYYGTPQQRTQLRRAKSKWGDIIITSYEVVMADAQYLQRTQWRYVIVDEGHRLKNIESKLMRVLKKFSTANRMLLTGTPLQNNLAELWALLNFLLPEVFADLDIFHSWFESGEANISGDDESGLVTSLHDILRPFLLRRLKKDVGLNLPPKREYVVFTGLTSLQQDLYRAFLDGSARQFVVDQIITESEASSGSSGNGTARTNIDDTAAELSKEAIKPRADGKRAVKASRGSHKAGQAARQEKGQLSEEEVNRIVKTAHQQLRTKSFSNLVMQLRLCCNSPYLFWDPWVSGGAVDERIETSSGKLMLLHRLMRRLKKAGHKVLVFTQFTKMLDLLEDWAVLRGYTYARIDGSTKQVDRQDMIEHFTDQDIDMFFLTTRSGGQGINLVGADTVIIFDSDWNPQQDLQAMDRVHRIGQTRPVLVLRLCTAETVEQDLLERAAKKLELNHIVIETGQFKTLSALEGTNEKKIEHMGLQLQRHSIKFEKGATSQITESDLDKILDRSPEAYENAKKHPVISDNTYCVASET